MNAKNPNTVPNKEKDRQNVNIEINDLYTTHMNSILITQKKRCTRLELHTLS